MDLEVIRKKVQTTHSTVGTLLIDSVYECVTLEPPKEVDPQGNGFVCIPTGTYPLKIYWSHKFGRHVPHVENVPNRKYIEIHMGNFPSNTDGCTLVGKAQPKDDFITLSLVTFTTLLSKLLAASVLTNPEADEKDHVWNVGSITYSEET